MPNPLSAEHYVEIAKYPYIIGCDEVGTGALAGPAVVTAVVYPSDFTGWDDLRDSKKYTNLKRRDVAAEKVYRTTLAFSQIYISVSDIDLMGMRWCLTNAFMQAIQECRAKYPDSLAVVDGNLRLSIPHISIPKADDLVPAVSAASVLAKVDRDWWMSNIAEPKSPGYGLHINKGYGTRQHYDAIHKLGVGIFHRRSFRLRNRCLDGGDPFVQEVREVTEREAELLSLRKEKSKLLRHVEFLEEKLNDHND